MWLISVQYTNLGVLGSTSVPIQLDLADPNFPLIDSVQKRDLPVILIAGNNGSGKTTLCAGIYFALRGSGTLNGRQIPKGVMTAGTHEMAVALTVRHSGQAKRFSNRNQEYHSDRITLVRTVVVRQDGNDYSYYMIDGHYNLAETFPYGAKVTAETYQRVLEAMGVNEGVLHAYEETLEQGSISKLADATAKDPRQMFDLLCRVIGATNARKDYEMNRRKTRDALILLNREVQSLKDRKIELERLLRKKVDYERLVDLRSRLEVQRVEQQNAEVQMYLAQKLLYDTRAVILDQQIAEKEAEIAQMRKDSVSLSQRTLQITLNHAGFKEKQKIFQTDLGTAQTFLGQYQAMCQASQDVIDHTPKEAIAKSLEEWAAEYEVLRERCNETYQPVKSLREQMREVDIRVHALHDQTSFNRFPEFVREFSLELTHRGIEHHLLADVLNITDGDWHKAIENYLGQRRFWAMIIGGKNDFDAAYKVVERMKYQPGIRAPRARPNRQASEYKATIWNILDLPPKGMEMWGDHLDDLGYQLMARSAEEARMLNQAKPHMHIFSPTGMVSQTDLFARSVMASSERTISLYCGKRAVELELKRLADEKEWAQKDLIEAEGLYNQAKQREEECLRLKQGCANYHVAQQKFTSAKASLQDAEDTIDRLSDAKYKIDYQVDEARNQMEQLRIERGEKDREIEKVSEEISQAQSSKRGYASQVLSEPNVSPAKIKEARQMMEQTIGEAIFNEKRVVKLESLVRDTRETQQTTDEKIRVLTQSIEEIPEHESLDETIPPKCEAVQVICVTVERAIAEKRIIFQANLRAAESEYRLLQQEMTRATDLVEQQANKMSGPLQADFRVRLNMPDTSFFKVEGDEFSVLEQLNALETQVMAVDVKVRFAKDLRREFRGVGDAWASGGQQEIACAALLGGILFAAQQMHAQGEITGQDWEKAPLLLLDEPFENLDIVNRRTMIGSLLTLPVQIIVLYPMPPLEFIQAADVVVTVEKSSGAGKPTLLNLHRGVRTMARAEFAAALRGDPSNGLAN